MDPRTTPYFATAFRGLLGAPAPTAGPSPDPRSSLSDADLALVQLAAAMTRGRAPSPQTFQAAPTFAVGPSGPSAPAPFASDGGIEPYRTLQRLLQNAGAPDAIEVQPLPDPRGNIPGTDIPDRGQPEDATAQPFSQPDGAVDLGISRGKVPNIDLLMELLRIPQDVLPFGAAPTPLRLDVSRQGFRGA